MIESMACGTPVIAFRSGSVPEVIDNGVSGFVVDGVEEAAKAVSGLSKIDRAAVRRAFENRFTVERMSRDYLKMYAGLPGVRRTNEIRTMNGAEIGFHLPL
jgi:glycosyltransferase involved in cell wall biosynthesis